MNLFKWLPFFLLGAFAESATQLCLKKGAAASQDREGFGYYLALARSRWVGAGISIYLVDVVVWLYLLGNVPLSLAFPLSGLEKPCTICLAVFVLKERISRVECIGIGLIFIGIAVIFTATY